MTTTSPPDYAGRLARTWRVTIPDRPDAAETVCVWLIEAPLAHPLWTQYVLQVVRLRDGVPGFPEPVRHFVGATHELLVAALDPAHPIGRDVFVDGGRTHILSPVNVVEHFEATDDELVTLAELAARGVCDGLLWPETSDAPDAIRLSWKAALVKTLAHIRGEEHAP